jgi:hypothetical protein
MILRSLLFIWACTPTLCAAVWRVLICSSVSIVVSWTVCLFVYVYYVCTCIFLYIHIYVYLYIYIYIICNIKIYTYIFIYISLSPMRNTRTIAIACSAAMMARLLSSTFYSGALAWFCMHSDVCTYIHIYIYI